MSIMFLQDCEKHKLRPHVIAKAVFPHSSPLEAQPLRPPDVVTPWVLLPAEPPGSPPTSASWAAAGAQERCEQLPPGQAWLWVARTRARELPPSHSSASAWPGWGLPDLQGLRGRPPSLLTSLSRVLETSVRLGTTTDIPRTWSIGHCA